MQQLPYRTNTTWLSNEDLIILDALFDGGAEFHLLRGRGFREQWNLGFSHELDYLRCNWRAGFNRCASIAYCKLKTTTDDLPSV